MDIQDTDIRGLIASGARAQRPLANSSKLAVFVLHL
jgi:hypothetical protein